jgi:hypothetical protein
MCAVPGGVRGERLSVAAYVAMTALTDHATRAPFVCAVLCLSLAAYVAMTALTDHATRALMLPSLSNA